MCVQQMAFPFTLLLFGGLFSAQYVKKNLFDEQQELYI